MPRYLVLSPISPPQGALILPAAAGAAPVYVDESLISDAAAPTLIALGVIGLADALDALIDPSPSEEE